MNRALILGHFSTFGDLICLELVEKRLKKLMIVSDVFPFDNDVRQTLDCIKSNEAVDPARYSYLIVCCGPYDSSMFNRKGIKLSDFSHCKRVVFNTTMVETIASWSPFQYLVERDSDQNIRTESAFLYDKKPNEFITTCFISTQGEHGDSQIHQTVITKVFDYLRENQLLSIPIDTKFPSYNNDANFESVDQFIAVASKSKVLITNRLHGMVFGLLAGVPVIVIDGIKGGGKLTKQCHQIGLPVIPGEKLSSEELNKAIIWAKSASTKALIQSIVDKSKIEAAYNLDLLESVLVSDSAEVNPHAENYGQEEMNSSSNRINSRFYPLLKVIKDTYVIWRNFAMKIPKT